MSRRILVTGGAGFVGVALVRHALAQGADVAVLARPTTDLRRLDGVREDVRIIAGDLAEPDGYAAVVRAFRPDVCFHLAWVTEPGVYAQSPLNAHFLLYSLDLLHCLFAAGCGEVVATGTCFEYAPSEAVLTEDAPLRYDSPYASAKNFAMQLGAELAKRAGANVAWARLFYMYGAGDHPKRLLPSLIAALKQDRAFAMTDGMQQVDYLHVRDVAAGLWSLAGQRGAFNVCTGEAIAVADLVTTVAELMGKRHLVELGALPRPAGIPLRIAGSRDKLTAATGWTPRIPLADGLRELIEATLPRT